MFMKETEDAIAVLCPQVVGTVGMLKYFLSFEKKKYSLVYLIF